MDLTARPSFFDLGIAFPLLALTPIFVVPVEWVLLREGPGLTGLLVFFG